MKKMYGLDEEKKSEFSLTCSSYWKKKTEKT